MAWVKDPEKEKYRYNLEQRLLQMDIPAGAILCDDVNCANEDHKKQLSIYSEDLIQMCVKAGDECFPKVRKKESQIPYWNENVQPIEIKRTILEWYMGTMWKAKAWSCF